jgi:cytochrome c-type biogenesis protein CcmE
MEQDVLKAPPRPSRRARWLAGGTLIALGLAGLAAWALLAPGAVSYYSTPSEIRLEAAASPDRTFRLGGRVAAGSLDRDGAVVSFAVTDGGDTIPVVYRGEVPDTLKEGTDVIAEGTLDGRGTLRATNVLAKCSSKYVPAEDADEHLGRTAAG